MLLKIGRAEVPSPVVVHVALIRRHWSEAVVGNLHILVTVDLQDVATLLQGGNARVQADRSCCTCVLIEEPAWGA